LLGLAMEKESPVMQGVVRAEKLVRGFDVSTANQYDVVLFAVNETTHDQTLYLTSTDGALRKIVSVKGGVGKIRPVSSEDKKLFETEKQFWLDRLAPPESPK
jgi:hypothetical protein